ncbi:MAG: glycosyltransferase family 2 protein [Clostridia bacterium]|nr:glycosyltransferase family 2 protein [Clostridia bacterium]MBR3255742.1 glycosyltransferase family 2 protein [Clostridia bacterium]
MENLHRVDILLATYNGEKYLKCQLDSILNQTYKNIRIVINDDASTDGTAEILKEYAKKDNRINLHFNEKNLGYIKNFENLLKRVENEYFMLADQDDYWMPDKVEKSLNKIIEDKADLVFTDLEAVDENLKTITSSVVKFRGYKKNIDMHNDYKLVFLHNCGVTGCTIITKKEHINKYIPIPQKKPMVHDWWMALMIGQNGKLSFLDETTIKYRQHKNNQVGIYGMKQKIKSADEYRQNYIKLKLDQFSIYVENEDKFENKDIPNLAKRGIAYMEDIKRKKIVNFKNYKTFFDLYNMEYPMMRLKTFVMLNLPIVAKFTYRLFK